MKTFQGEKRTGLPTAMGGVTGGSGRNGRGGRGVRSLSWALLLTILAAAWPGSHSSVLAQDISIVIDNLDAANTSKTGTWAVSGGTAPYGVDSVWARGGDDTFTWHFTPPVTGSFEVFEWHSTWSTRPSAAPHRIAHSGGTKTISVNQKINGGKWNSLGVYSFDAGVGYGVTVTSVNDSSSTCADAVRLVYVPDSGSVTEVVIDNGDPGTSFTGSWASSGAPNPFDPSEPGATSLWSRDGATYTWTFTPSVSGNYQVSMWWTQYTSRSTNIPVTIEYSGGTDSVTVNQRVNGGKWNVFGSYPFTAGVSYDVKITAQPGPASTCADAVRFVHAGAANQLPVASIDTISPKAAAPGDEIYFRGTGVDADGSVVANEWSSDRDGLLSAQAEFRSSSLSPGIHSISFRVKDNLGAWSKKAVSLVVVRDCGPAAIMPLGDSITYGTGEIDDPNFITGYRQPLYQSLKIAGYDVNFVGDRSTGGLFAPAFDTDHQGVPGIRDDEVAAFVYNWLVVHPPEIVLLHIGTNAFNSDPADVENILDEIDRYEADFNTQVVVVLARIINRKTYHLETTIFNNNVQDMAEARIAAGDKIVVVDQESALVYSTDMDDNLHPKNIGYAKMAGVWKKALVDLLPICGDSSPPVIIDNGDPETSSTGTWLGSGAVNPFDPAEPGATSLWSRDGARYTWTFSPTVSGTYELSMWWTQYSSRSTSIPVTIRHSGGTSSVTINQRVNGGKWNVLGSYSFVAGGSYDITIISQPSPSSTCADAVRFVNTSADL